VTGTYLGHILEHVTLELQSLAGVKTDFGRARETSERGVYKVVIEFIEPEVALVAMQAARSLIMAAVENVPFDVQAAVREIRDTADQVCLGPGTGAIVKAAEERGIPAIRLNTGSLVQLGYSSAQKRIWTAETDATSAVAESIAQDKQLTGGLLRAVGIPVPEGTTVESPEQAIEFAESEGYPIVIKPRDGNHGRGVFVNLHDAAAIRVAYELAAKEGSAVVAEQMIPGIQHRVLVVGSRVVAVGRADPDRVVGDGVHTIEQLVAIANDDPRRGSDGGYPLSLLTLDDIALGLLKQQSMAVNTVPAPGQFVVLNYNGDCVTDVTEQIHGDVAEQCVLAAQTVGLNIAGVDLIVEDIRKPLSTQKGAVIEVNASPGLVMHVKPVHGTPRPVGAAIVSSLFPEGATGRVPVFAVTGTNGKTSTVDLLEQILTAAGKRVGIASSDAVRANGRRLAQLDAANFDGARRVLMNPFVDCAVLEIGAASVLNEGLGFDQCQVAVVTNLGSGDHLGAKYVETLEVMTKVKRAPVDVVLPGGTAILNASDPVVAGLAQYCPGSTLYFSSSPTAPGVSELLQTGAQVITIDRSNVVLCRAERSIPIVPVSLVAHSAHGRHAFQIENVLAAIAAAHAHGLDAKQISEGLTRAVEMVRPRFASFELRGATVFLSYCRNPSALRATLAAIAHWEGATLRKAMYGVFADQGLDAVREQGAALGNYFDEVFCGFADDASSMDPRLLDELVDAIQSTTRQCAALRAHGPLLTDGHLESQLEGLTGREQLLIQVKDSNTLADVAKLVRVLGGTELATGPMPFPNASSAGRESKGAQTQSNNP
jgi:cyanophycin synthetase